MLRVEIVIIVWTRVFICDTLCADIGLQPGTTGGIESDSLELSAWDSLSAVDGGCQEEMLSLDTLLNGLFLFLSSRVSHGPVCFPVLGSETQWRSEKTFSLNPMRTKKINHWLLFNSELI